MRVAQINAVSYGSTGRIMFQLADALKSADHEVLCTTGFTWNKCNRTDHFVTSGFLSKTYHMFMSKVFGNIGSYSNIATRRLIKRLRAFKPDIIHLHNIHGWYLNFPLLFSYIKKSGIPVVWTLHDCWSFTGHCPHFIGIGCEKWKTHCDNCSLYRQYPGTFFDRSHTMYEKKIRWFTGIDNLSIVSPSKWIKSAVRDSFLREYEVYHIPNGIDLSVFHPNDTYPSSLHALKSSGKKIVLGVSYAWDYKKGLDVFIELSKRLGEAYRIILVGTDDTVDAELPDNIISVHRTTDQSELASIYSAAEVFVNPTREENFPTVHMEAIACGTPVVSFDIGGCAESILPGCGTVVPKDDIVAMEHEIRRICNMNEKMCSTIPTQFDQNLCIQKYLELYNDILAE